MNLKSKFIVSTFILAFFGFGCSDVSKKVVKNSDSIGVRVADVGTDASEYETFDRDGIYFKYPKGLDVTYGSFTFHSNIDVIKKPLDAYVDYCDESFKDRSSYGNEFWGLGSKQKERLRRMKEQGLTSSNYGDLLEIDPIACYTSRDGDISSHVYKLLPWSDSDTRGIIRYQYRGDDCCSINHFTVELTALNKFNELVTIVFRYSISGYDPSSYNVHDYKENLKAESQVKAFIGSGIQPSLSWLKNMGEAQKEIDMIISNVRID